MWNIISNSSMKLPKDKIVTSYGLPKTHIKNNFVSIYVSSFGEQSLKSKIDIHYSVGTDNKINF